MYIGFTLFFRLFVDSPSSVVRPSVTQVGAHMVTTRIHVTGFKHVLLYVLFKRRFWGDWISESYLIKFAHHGRFCDLQIFCIPEFNFWFIAPKFGMLRTLGELPGISSGFFRIFNTCIFVFTRLLIYPSSHLWLFGVWKIAWNVFIEIFWYIYIYIILIWVYVWYKYLEWDVVTAF